MSEKPEQAKYSTEDYESDDRQIINAGSIDEDGLELVIESEPQARKGTYGTYWSLEVQLIGEDGEEVPAVINFSGKKLHRMIEDVYDAIKGERIFLWASGEKFSRRYYISPVE